MSDIVTVPGKELKKLQLKARAFDGLPFCPDHRDKVANKPCRECEIAHLQAENKLLRKELNKNAAFVYNQAILATPTGELRNKLTELNILRLQALQEKPK